MKKVLFFLLLGAACSYGQYVPRGNAFAQAMNQATQTTSDVIFNSGSFGLGAISFGNTAGLNAYIDSDGSGDLSGGNIMWTAAGDLLTNTVATASIGTNGGQWAINSAGTCFFGGGAISFGDATGSFASIDAAGNGVFGSVTTASITSDGGSIFSNSIGALTAIQFIGGGAGLTNLNASALLSGAVPFAQLPIGTSSSTAAVGNDSRFPASVTGLRKSTGAGSTDVAAISSDFPKQLYAGSFSGTGTATTAFVVTIGTTQAGTTYKVNVTPTAALSAAVFYVSTKTTTTFTVNYLAGLTGTVTFDWVVAP